MSRCNEWNSALQGFGWYLVKQGFILDIRGIKGKSDRYYGVELHKIINKYCRVKKIQGSFSTRILKMNEDFKSFREWVTENRQTYLAKYLDTSV